MRKPMRVDIRHSVAPLPEACELCDEPFEKVGFALWLKPFRNGPEVKGDVAVCRHCMNSMSLVKFADHPVAADLSDNPWGLSDT